MYNVIIWGIGRLYEACFNSIKLQELKGQIKVLAIISYDKDIKTFLDGYPVLSLEDALVLFFKEIIQSD